MNPSPESSRHSGRFITFEGIDGAGKSTHIEYVTDLLRRQNRSVVVTREPGGTALGEKLRELLLHEAMHPETEALLMFAARREHLDKVIEPALARGDWVISDRFSDASFAYQGGGRGLSASKLRQLETWVHPCVQPDLTLLFDVSPEVARSRLAATRLPDKFEQEKSRFFNRVREAYRQRAEEFPDRFRIIDSSQPIQAIRETLTALVAELEKADSSFNKKD